MSGAMNGSAASALVAQLAAARRRRVELAGGVVVDVDTPSQFAAHMLVEAMRSNAGDELITQAVRLVRGWSGVTGAMLLGGGVGSDDAAPYAPELLQAWLADRPSDVHTLVLAAVEAARAARERAEGGEKN